MLDSSICRAIFRRKLLNLTYKFGVRVVEPYCFGQSKDDNDILRAFQVRGDSDSGQPSGWKLFRVDEIISIEILEEEFLPRHDFRPNDPAMARIYCQL